MHQLSTILSIGAGGALGAILRYGAAQIFPNNAASGFPAVTVFINVLGSFVMGVLAVILLSKLPSNTILQGFLMIGLLGGFTTFSTFSLDVMILIERGAIGVATIYVLASVSLSIVALFCGMILGRIIT